MSPSPPGLLIVVDRAAPWANLGKKLPFVPLSVSWISTLFILRDDLSVVEAEFIPPRAWIDSLGLVKGARLDLAVPELEIDGLAEVTAVRECPPIAEGEGRVVTGRFVTREAVNVVTVRLANGTEIRSTDVHAVWSVDREDWVTAGKLGPGEQVDTLEGPVVVVSVERLESPLDVYNIEVHGEHVFRVTADGVLVHNACASTSGNNLAARIGQQMHASYKTGQADFITTFKEKLLPSGRKIDFLDIAHGIVYELKPNNPKAIARGMRQAENYIQELNSLFPGMNWHIVIDVYSV